MRKKYTPVQIASALLVVGMTSLVLTAIFALVFMLLWNWIAAGLFGLPAVGFFPVYVATCLIGLIVNRIFRKK